MSSGIAIAGEYATSLEGLNKREHSVVILKINKGMTAVEVDKVIKATPDSDPVAEWKNIIKQMPEGDCRYVISDFQFKETPTVTKSKIIMILWSPDDAPTKAKMYVPFPSPCPLDRFCAGGSLTFFSIGNSCATGSTLPRWRLWCSSPSSWCSTVCRRRKPTTWSTRR